jgi:hypothetical protein
MNWDQWLAQQRAPQAPAQPSGFQRFFGLPLPGANASGGAAPGMPVSPGKQGMYTPNIAIQQAGPATPIDYSRIRALLSSGALRNGGQVNDPGPTPEPVEPPPAPAKPAHPLAQLLSIFGGLK